jgi:serine/threonine protein kinase
LHLAIDKRRSLDVVKALLQAYLEGAGARMTDGELELPLSMALATFESSDDVVLAVLAAYPDAAKDILSYDNGDKEGISMLPLHYAIEGECSLDIVKALLNAYPEGAKEKNPVTNNLPLHDAINQNASEGIQLLLLNAYPQATKKKMQDGWLPIEVCVGNKASEDLIVALLKADMPLRAKDGSPAEHSGSWTACVSTDSAADAVSRILSPVSEGGGGFGVHIHALAAVCDAEGRTALGLSSSRPRAAIYEYLLFSRRYELQNGAPEHRTPTAVVLRAQDLGEKADYGAIFDEADEDKNGQLDRQEVATIALSKIGLDPKLFLKGSDVSTISKEDFVGICKRQLGDGPRNVVIKLMQNENQWERECNARKEYNLDPKYVVSTLSNIPSAIDIAGAVNRGDGGLKTIVDKFLDGVKPGKFAIVMDAADRNLHQIFYQEQPKIDAVRVMLRQVFEAVKHLHEKNLMHGDLKMLNIVRFRIDNRLRLIDFDASAKIVARGGEDESFAGAKFSSAILPPEMIERIETEEELEKFNKYWKSESDEVLKEKVAPKIYKEQKIEIARYVVKSFRTEDGEPVYAGLPYKLVKASENIDVWALGVLAFTLLTGETLIPSTRDDDCASGAAMHVLYSWGEETDESTDFFKKIHDDTARDLVEQLLQRKPKNRPTVAYLLETHPFFHPSSITLLDKIEDVKNTVQNEAKQRQDDRALLERIDANIEEIKELSFESQDELRRIRSVFLKGIFEATEVKTPTTFIVLNDELPPKPSDEKVKKILDIVAAEDGSGVSFQTKNASLALSADGADFNLEGDLKEYHDQVEVGMKWVKSIKSVGAKVAAGEVGKGAFEIINEGIENLIVGKKMYLYLIDELTGEPVRAEGWPITITKPSKIVPKLRGLGQKVHKSQLSCSSKKVLWSSFALCMLKSRKAPKRRSQCVVPHCVSL